MPGMSARVKASESSYASVPAVTQACDAHLCVLPSLSPPTGPESSVLPTPEPSAVPDKPLDHSAHVLLRSTSFRWLSPSFNYWYRVPCSLHIPSPPLPSEQPASGFKMPYWASQSHPPSPWPLLLVVFRLLHFATKSQSLTGPPFPADLSSALLGCPCSSSCPSVPLVSSAVSFCLSLSTQPLPLLCLLPFPVSELTSNYTLGMPVLPDALSYSVFPSVYNYECNYMINSMTIDLNPSCHIGM